MGLREVLNFDVDGWRRHTPTVHHAIGSAGFHISFALLPAGPIAEPTRVSQSGGTTIVELHLAAQPGLLLYCRIDANSRELSFLRRQAHRDLNHKHSAWAIAAMVLLLALCGWITGGNDGARRALSEGRPRPDSRPDSRTTMLRWLGARALRPEEMPDLFNVLAEICRRARLCRLPELYYLAEPTAMNAYACGDRVNSAIVVTEGLLRGMSRGEIASILAHEVAHIYNQDAWAMDWAAVLNRAIEQTSFAGLAHLRAPYNSHSGHRSLAGLLCAARAIARLLFLALSRVRERDADATALELTGDPQTLVTALAKLERHHAGSGGLAIAAFGNDPARFLRSHPATSERVGTLLSLAP
jgi:heat shock protein HtpX